MICGRMADLVSRFAERLPIELFVAGQINARVARQGRLGEMHDSRATVGRLLNLGQDLPQVQRNIRLDRKLATGDTKNRFHQTVQLSTSRAGNEERRQLSGGSIPDRIRTNNLRLRSRYKPSGQTTKRLLCRAILPHTIIFATRQPRMKDVQ
jgi:hypothetical protein